MKVWVKRFESVLKILDETNLVELRDIKSRGSKSKNWSGYASFELLRHSFDLQRKRKIGKHNRQ